MTLTQHGEHARLLVGALQDLGRWQLLVSLGTCNGFTCQHNEK